MIGRWKYNQAVFLFLSFSLPLFFIQKQAMGFNFYLFTVWNRHISFSYMSYILSSCIFINSHNHTTQPNGHSSHNYPHLSIKWPVKVFRVPHSKASPPGELTLGRLSYNSPSDLSQLRKEYLISFDETLCQESDRFSFFFFFFFTLKLFHVLKKTDHQSQSCMSSWLQRIHLLDVAENQIKSSRWTWKFDDSGYWWKISFQEHERFCSRNTVWLISENRERWLYCMQDIKGRPR